MQRSEIDEALAAATRFLVDRQDDAGLWCDYDLDPGSSEAWTTAFVANALAQGPPRRTAGSAIASAVVALDRLRAEVGWAFRPGDVPDAETTARVWQLLARTRPAARTDGVATLLAFAAATGTPRTFLDPARDGRWAKAHADVIPVVGLALVACGAERRSLARIRRASLDARVSTGVWRSFWWSTDACAIARNLELLGATGGVPDDVRQAATGWLRDAGEPATPLEEAEHLVVAVTTSGPRSPHARHLVANVLAGQRDDGGWAPSAARLLPPRHDPRQNAPPFADVRRLVTTATAVAALVRYAHAAANREGLFVADRVAPVAPRADRVARRGR